MGGELTNGGYISTGNPMGFHASWNEDGSVDFGRSGLVNAPEKGGTTLGLYLPVESDEPKWILAREGATNPVFQAAIVAEIKSRGWAPQ